MRFELVQRFRAPLDAVESAFVDPDFLAELGRLPKLGQPDLLDQADTGDQLRQRVRYLFAGQLSPKVKAVVDPARLSWVEESTLDRATHRTTFRIVPDHYGRLLEASGLITLTAGSSDRGDPADVLTNRRAVGELVIHMPLVGRRVEAAIVGGLREHAALEIPVVERWAADHA